MKEVNMVSPDRLRRFPHFANIEHRVQAFIATNSNATSFSTGDVILREGNTAKELMFLEKGEVDIVYRLGDDRIIVVDTIMPGETFSWSAGLPPHRLRSTAIAKTDGEYFGFERVSLTELCKLFPAFGCRMMTEIAQVLRRRLINTRVQLAAADSVAELQTA
jgi:CRP-like cAMP-binding protein